MNGHGGYLKVVDFLAFHFRRFVFVIRPLLLHRRLLRLALPVHLHLRHPLPTEWY